MPSEELKQRLYRVTSPVGTYTLFSVDALTAGLQVEAAYATTATHVVELDPATMTPPRRPLRAVERQAAHDDGVRIAREHMRRDAEMRGV